MKWRKLAILGLIGTLTGCDDTTITQVGRRTFLKAPELAKNQGAQPVPVEIHGLPWPGADPNEVIATIRMPQGRARHLRFQAVPPGQGHIGGGNRLVLHFNPSGASNKAAACRTTGILPSQPPDPGEFSVFASYCQGQDWIIHAFMETRAEPDDWFAYYTAMEELMGTVFPAQ